jgi:hypothetical protein
MEIKEFLLTTESLNLTGIAKLMWPSNKSAKTYLSKKLNGLDGRTFTDKDAALALKALNELADDIKKLKHEPI